MFSILFGCQGYYRRAVCLSCCNNRKGLCDKPYTISPVKTIKNLKELLFEDLRIDEDLYNSLNKEDILKLAPMYHSTNLYLLEKLIK